MHEMACIEQDPQTLFLCDPGLAHMTCSAITRSPEGNEKEATSRNKSKCYELKSVSEQRRERFPGPSEIQNAERLIQRIELYKKTGIDICLSEVEECSRCSSAMRTGAGDASVLKIERKALWLRSCKAL